VLVYLAVNIAVIRAFRTEFREEFRFWRHLVIPAMATLLLLFPCGGSCGRLRTRRSAVFGKLGRVFMPRSWPAGADARPQRCARLAGLVNSGRVHIRVPGCAANARRPVPSLGFGPPFREGGERDAAELDRLAVGGAGGAEGDFQDAVAELDQQVDGRQRDLLGH
jgi:hypothetical protein